MDNLPDSDDFNEASLNLQAQFDQIGAGLKDFAAPLMAFYEGLMQQGFRNDEAFTLVRDYFNHMMCEDDDD